MLVLLSITKKNNISFCTRTEVVWTFFKPPGNYFDDLRIPEWVYFSPNPFRISITFLLKPGNIAYDSLALSKQLNFSH
jgi:hypothetical protein